MHITRRNFLALSGVTAGVGILQIDSPSLAEELNTEGTSQNGWKYIHDSQFFRVEGSSVSVSLAVGMPSLILTYIIRRWNYEIETLSEKSVRYTYGELASDNYYHTNFNSGTAIYINEAKYPKGVDQAFYPEQLAVIRNIIEQLNGAVTWGGDFEVPEPGYFQLAYGPDSIELEQISLKIESLFSPDSAENIGNLADYSS